MDNEPNGSTIQPLPEDNDSPASPAVPSNGQVDTHQATDPDLDADQIYQEGVAAAAGIDEPNKGNAVVSFDPMVARHDDPDKDVDATLDSEDLESQA